MKITVTDHAIIRYMERVMGVDTDLIRQQIVTDTVVDYIRAYGGNGTYPHSDDTRVVVKDHSIITVI